ncbi:MAG: hypothetical protein Q7V31_10440, partial [Parvibaculum sp.]|uniref:hypothetical protein n=1 Tax=Parvibaculum sp. TaxID=2024848 RepID=UPI002718BD20
FGNKGLIKAHSASLRSNRPISPSQKTERESESRFACQRNPFMSTEPNRDGGTSAGWNMDHRA